MKKQLLIAAVAATMTSAAFADISISGSAKVNYTNTEATAAVAAVNTSAIATNALADNVTDSAANYETTPAAAAVVASNDMKKELDLTIVGKTGDTSVVLSVSNDDTDGDAATNANLKVENSYVTTSISGINIKTGQWAKTSDTLLTNQVADYDSGKISLDTTISGVKVQFEDQNTGDASVTVSGEVAGVKLSHENFKTSTDTKVSTDVAGVSIAYRTRAYDAARKDASSLQLSTEVSGMTFTYARIDTDSADNTIAAATAANVANAKVNLAAAATAADATAATTAYMNSGMVSADAFIAGTDIYEANAFGVATTLAGNAVQLKRMNITDRQGEDKVTELKVTRALSNGSTFEAIYSNTDNAGVAEDTAKLDLELAVKF